MSADRHMTRPHGPQPWLQQHWDARAATNFMAGGAGSGLVVASAIAAAPPWMAVLGALLMQLGLLAVWAESGRPLRALNVLRHVRRSWMTREALAAMAVFAAVAAWWGLPGAALPLSAAAATAGLLFVLCQGRILQAAKGIPAWREPLITPLIVSTGLAEGAGLALMLLAPSAVLAPAGPTLLLVALFAAALLARLALWAAWRRRLRAGDAALAAIDRAGHIFKGCTLAALMLALVALLAIAAPLLVLALPAAGLLALAGGLWFKFTLVRRAAFNQGFGLTHLPVRGVPHVSPPISQQVTPHTAPHAAPHAAPGTGPR